MNQEIKKQWITALRSGKFEQGRGHLHSNGKYCCLGVLSKIVDPSEMHMGIHYLRPYVIDKCELRSNDPYVKIDEATRERLRNKGVAALDDKQLSTLNDSNFTFQEIADLIEKDTSL